MSYTFRTMIVPVSLQSLAQSVAAGLGGEAGAGMWATGLSATGAEQASHYVSTGMIEDQFAGLLTDAAMLFGACQAAGLSTTLAQCQSLIDGSDVSEEPPFDAFARLGLQLVQDTPDTP